MKTLNLTTAQGNLKKSNNEAPFPPHQMATLQSLLLLRRFSHVRLPCPWDSPGKNTGVGCHFLLQCM